MDKLQERMEAALDAENMDFWVSMIQRRNFSEEYTRMVLRMFLRSGFRSGFNTAQEPEFQPVKEGDGREPFAP